MTPSADALCPSKSFAEEDMTNMFCSNWTACPSCSSTEISVLHLDTGERQCSCRGCHLEWSAFPDSTSKLESLWDDMNRNIYESRPSLKSNESISDEYVPVIDWSSGQITLSHENYMPKVYVAGPLRGRTPYETERNVRQARDAAENLWKQGFAVFCPHLNTYGMVGMLPDEVQFIKGDLLFLQGCDILMLLPGWMLSEGAKMEEAEARRIHLRRLLYVTENEYRDLLTGQQVCLQDLM